MRFPSISKIAYLSLLFASLCIAGMNNAIAEEINLPELGSPSDQYLTPTDEKRLGRAFMLSVKNKTTVLDDPLIEEYIQNLGAALLKQSDASGQDYTFFVLEDPSINAFAGPGGYIGIYSGLILATQTESELASVVAHEIAHVTQKHLLRAFDAANRMSGKTAALILASILVGVAGSPDAGIAMATGAQASAIQEQINFTRSNEEEADTVGIQILADAEFDPRAMPVFFERLTHASRLYESGIPEILRTHPVTTNRVADALGRAETYDYRQYPGSLRYYLTRETLRVNQFKEPKDAIQHFSSGLDEGRHLNEEAHRYGYALALMADSQFKTAEQTIEALLKQRPQQLEYILASAKIARQLGKPKDELKILDTYYQLMPENYPLSVAYIEALTTAKRYRQARSAAAHALSLRANDTRLYRLVGKVEELAGNQAESHRLLAEAYVTEGRLRAAIQQLETALKMVDGKDFHQTSRIESRLIKIKQAAKQEERKEKG
ncbi:MAG: M48 family metalloprotease [Candidatus Thiodiazotropha sp. (ex Monitilora ramsayi)]|nr:M48 family metalloprotease [Candidatus Thiodiazotropha sp. (ex Monitilora ramsayi)]